MRIPFVLLAVALWAIPACAQHEQHDHAGAATSMEPHSAHQAASLTSAAEAEIEVLRAAVARYEDHAAAVADGYRKFGKGRGTGNPLMGEHWVRKDVVDQPLDLTRPSTLIYATIDGEPRLVGVAWTLHQYPGEPLPEGFSGDADHWHVHHVPALAAALVANRPLLSRIVERRAARGEIGAGDGRSELTMLHAWIGLENPAGVFANDNPALPYAMAGLALDWAQADAPSAAKGVALLLPGRCAGRRVSVADACDEAASRVGAAAEDALAGTLAPAAFNAEAADAWEDYARVVFASLTPEQRERIAALEAGTTH